MRTDQELHELAQRPLMLSIFTLAYQGAAPEDFPTEGAREAQQRQVFATYVERMLGRRQLLQRWKKEQVMHWLAFLARQLHCRDQTVFFIESLQPDWLSGARQVLYLWSVGLVGPLVFGLIGTLVFGLIGMPVEVLVFGLPLGLLFGLAIGGASGLVGGRDISIRPAEALTWSSEEARPQLVGALCITPASVLAGVILGAVSRLGSPLVGALVGMLFGPLLWLLSGLSGKQLPEDDHLSPNEGIWRSGKSGLLFGLLGVLAGALVGGLLFGLVGGLLFGLLSGLSAFVQHFVLRVFLWRQGELPRTLTAFLDEAAARLLLRKVGGGYSFAHGLLRDYFASLEKEES